MEIRSVIHDFVYECKDLSTRLQSKDQGSLTEVDLVMLRTQLFVLDTAASNLLELKRLHRKSSCTVEAETESSTAESAPETA